MRRLLWFVLGAIAGVLVYRRAQRGMAEAREQGAVVTAQQWAGTAASVAVGARGLAQTATRWVQKDTAQESARGLRRDP